MMQVARSWPLFSSLLALLALPLSYGKHTQAHVSHHQVTSQPDSADLRTCRRRRDDRIRLQLTKEPSRSQILQDKCATTSPDAFIHSDTPYGLFSFPIALVDS